MVRRATRRTYKRKPTTRVRSSPRRKATTAKRRKTKKLKNAGWNKGKKYIFHKGAYKNYQNEVDKQTPVGRDIDMNYTRNGRPHRAKPVGKRTSASGKTYYEYRRNRTDKDHGEPL